MDHQTSVKMDVKGCLHHIYLARTRAYPASLNIKRIGTGLSEG